jgi:hypothetical protein
LIILIILDEAYKLWSYSLCSFSLKFSVNRLVNCPVIVSIVCSTTGYKKLSLKFVVS